MAFVLPLNEKNISHTAMFLQAITEPKYRKSLPPKGLPPNLAQVLSLARDPKFERLCKQTVSQYKRYQKTRKPDAIVAKGKELRAYMKDNYPLALKTFKSLATQALHAHPDLPLPKTHAHIGADSTVTVHAVIAVYGISALFVYVNGAVFTNVAVAAYAVAVAAVIAS